MKAGQAKVPDCVATAPGDHPSADQMNRPTEAHVKNSSPLLAVCFTTVLVFGSSGLAAALEHSQGEDPGCSG